jgi:hypothetical protein
VAAGRAATLVAEHPARFGLLAALPTDDCQAALSEVKRAELELRADGYAVTCRYNGVYLSDPGLEPFCDSTCAGCTWTPPPSPRPGSVPG